MAGKTKPKARKPAYQVRLEVEEAKAFDTFIEQRAAQASETGGTANASTVLRGLVRDALVGAKLLNSITK